MKKIPAKAASSKESATPETLARAISVEQKGYADLAGNETPEVNVRLYDHDLENMNRSPEMPLNAVIRYQTQASSFKAYQAFIDGVMAAIEKRSTAGHTGFPADMVKSFQSLTETSHCTPVIKLHGTLAYEVLRLATEAFLLTRCGPTCMNHTEGDGEWPVEMGEFISKDAQAIGMSEQTYRSKLSHYLQALGNGEKAATPYLDIIVDQLALYPPVGDPLTKLYASRYECPLMIELIWSYWHEEGMLSQTMAAIGIRFQNRRSRPGADPLTNFETDPLRPLNNLLWGWIQSEYRRLSVQRRAYEYDHHYGIPLKGKAVPQLRSADSRSKFLESFHNLLREASVYFEDSSITTKIPDGFPLLNALRGTHLVLAEGAHNQYGDLPWTARVEMLIEQWLLARPEMREFLRSRPMVPYQQSWMGQVDAMKKLQDWTDVTVTHHHELATCGEAILLSVRHGPWATTNAQTSAKAWASYWRPEIQRYIYAYKAVTGVDITLEPTDNTVPAQLISARLAQQRLAAGGTR